MLFDHDAKVSGDSAPFADFPDPGGQQPWAVCVKDWAYWAIAASRTWKITRPPGRGLAAMWFSSDRAALAPQCDFRTIRLRQIVEDYTIGNVVADAGLPALVPEQHLDGKTDCPADTGLRDSRAGGRKLLRSDRLGPIAEDRPHFYVQTFGRRIRRRAGQLAVLAGPGSVPRLMLYH